MPEKIKLPYSKICMMEFIVFIAASCFLKNEYFIKDKLIWNSTVKSRIRLNGCNTMLTVTLSG